jgi:hypothetical protein
MGPGLSASLVSARTHLPHECPNPNQKAICISDHDDDEGREINQRRSGGQRAPLVVEYRW